MARGDANGSRLHPECLARGDRHGSRLHPDRVARGDRNGLAKLNDGDVRSIFQLRAQRWSQTKIAAEFGVSQVLISDILARKTWAHVEVGQPGVLGSLSGARLPRVR
jgi:hypothetical protein